MSRTVTIFHTMVFEITVSVDSGATVGIFQDGHDLTESGEIEALLMRDIGEETFQKKVSERIFQDEQQKKYGGA